MTGVVAGALFGLLHGQERLARAQADGVTAAEALRLSAFVLSGELRLLQPDEDIARFAPESAAVRALRGFALVCGASAAGILVRYRGVRTPDPAKDSVLVLRADSAARPLPLTGTAPAHAGCAAGPGERVELWGSARPRIRPWGRRRCSSRAGRTRSPAARCATAGAMAAGSP